MRFETARMIKTIDDLRAAAPGTPSDECRLMDVLSRGFASLNFSCERREISGSLFPALVAPWFGWLGVCLCITLGAVFTFQGSGPPARLIPWLLGPLLYTLTARYGFRFGWRLPPWGKASLLIARPEEQTGTAVAVRVVLQTPVGPITPPSPWNPWWMSTTLIAVIVVLPWLFAERGFDSIPGWLRLAAIAALAWLWFACTAQAVAGFRTGKSAPRVSNADLTGPACLLELARVWPVARTKQVELVLLATGGQRLDFAGARAVANTLESEWPHRPTLLILFFGPGIGEMQVIASRKHYRLGEQAASGLWIPHQTTKKPEALLALWPLERRMPDHIAIVGSDCLRDTGAEVHADSLRRAGELALEIALRWAKTQETKEPQNANDRATTRNSERHQER
jgi:hypothetical protein